MGKSGLIGRKISATLSSTGAPSFFLHPAEALHGDLGMLARGDAMLAVSYGGEAQEVIPPLGGVEGAGKALGILAGCARSPPARGGERGVGASGEGGTR